MIGVSIPKRNRFTILERSPKILILLISVIFFLTGCNTLSSRRAKSETKEDVYDSIGAVAGAISGKELTAGELKELSNQIRSDPEARAAIEAISDSVSKQGVKVKYCPITGKRYSFGLQYCPVHNVELKIVE